MDSGEEVALNSVKTCSRAEMEMPAALTEQRTVMLLSVADSCLRVSRFGTNLITCTQLYLMMIKAALGV